MGGVPEDKWHICNADVNRLKLNWNQGRLYCDDWNWDENRNSDLAVFVVMV